MYLMQEYDDTLKRILESDFVRSNKRTIQISELLFIKLIGNVNSALTNSNGGTRCIFNSAFLLPYKPSDKTRPVGLTMNEVAAKPEPIMDPS